MTCFWDGIISSLNNDDLKILGLVNKPTPRIMAHCLKKLNKKTKNIKWNNYALSLNQQEENYIHISDYTEESINEGYLCSICDPFLCLLCDILNCNITHNYLNKPMYYTVNSSFRTIEFTSNRGHFWKK